MADTDIPKVSTFVRERLRVATEREIRQAQSDYEEYVDILLRVYIRLDREGFFERA